MLGELKNKLAGIACCLKGVAAIEFALLAPVIIVIMYGVYDYGQAMLKKMELRSATRAGAQFALSGSTDQTAIANVVTAATGLTLSSVSVQCNCMNVSTGAITSSGTCSTLTCLSTYAKLADVSATYSYDFLFGATALTLSANTTVRIE